MSETREHTAYRALLIAGHLNECATACRYVAQACEQGANHASETSAAGVDFLTSAREIHARCDGLVSFVDAGEEFTRWEQRNIQAKRDDDRASGAAVFLTWPELATIQAALNAYSLAMASRDGTRLSELEGIARLQDKMREVHRA